MRQIKIWLTNNWEYLLGFFASLLVLFYFLWYKLVSIPQGYNINEVVVHNKLAAKQYTFQYIFHNLAFAPYYLGLMIPQYLNRYGLFSIRSVGAFFGLLSVLIFFYISWRWWGSLIAFLGTLLFTTSFWFLIVSRNSGPIILYILSALMIILLGFVIKNKKRNDAKTLLAALAAVLLVYVPGMIWFLLVAVILQRKLVIEEFKKLPYQVKIIIPIGMIILTSPLLYKSATNLEFFKNILGLPLTFSAKLFIKNVANWFMIIFIRSPGSPTALGHLPILNIFTDIMFILGIYWIWLKRNLERIYLIGISLLLSIILFSLAGPVSIYLGLPFIMCVAVTGMAFMLKQWFTVFPRNPVARTVGITLLSLAVLSVSFYHIEQYFIAWPKTTTTLTVYSTHRL